jgi:uncharacterized DUF497 family protein
VGRKQGLRELRQAWRQLRNGACRIQGRVRHERLDDREDYGEERLAIIGMSGHTILYVVYTLREMRIRLISARRATRHEQVDYYQQNA